MTVQPPEPGDTSETASLDSRIIAVMRFILAFSALLITLIDPSEPDGLVAVTSLALALYTAYSAALYIITRRHGRLYAWAVRWAHWADVGWYVVLIALSSGTSSIFFFGFFFAILVASFSHGFREALRVIAVSAILFTTIGFLTTPKGAEFELNRFLIRPIYMVVFGYMIAYWGDFEITLKRRLALLNEVNTLANPRFGVDRTTGWVIERLRRFYDADACMLITMSPSTGEHHMRRADGRDPERAMHVESLPSELAQRLLGLPANHAVVYNRTPRLWPRRQPRYHCHDIRTRASTAEGRAVGETIAAALDARSFVAVPLRYRGEAIGRLYLTAARGHAFSDSDADFLLQVVDHLAPVLENIRLVDRLASDAAEAERRRIARDLHDSVIQPYVGLRIGLAAINQKLEAGDKDVIGDNRRLIEQIDKVIASLRGYMRELKEAGGADGMLLPAARRFAATFTETTGIAVRIDSTADMRLDDRLAAEVFQMVAEGLSNIRRHTHSMQATIVFARRDNHLVLRIEDAGANAPPPAPFSPRSIAERAEALGGHVRVEPCEDGGSAVIVEIPL